ncbi:MAG TPA: N-acetylmuramoyl-L-alanine amidase [Terriglobales bacterium]|nr:N-acetylmuramoyl-L-alanine amidase [Terriglobales bacterium]
MRLAAALTLLLLALPGHARVRHNDAWARTAFTKAEQMREALNGRPAPDRSRHDYRRVIDAYRRVYFGSPASSRSDASVVAVAELQVEMGRRFDDNKILQSAVKQYEFLRREYPGSKYRFDALFTIGEIYKDDLDDPEEAQATFEEFLHRYPRNRLAEDAHQAIADLKQDAAGPQKEAALREAERYQRAADIASKQTKPAGETDRDETSDEATAADNVDRAKQADASTLPRVTGIRHWSTPDYTRVAIDVEQDVKFNSQRIDHPERIFFDLYNTKLASTLVGKSFDVEDGFLKKIRVAQFKPGKTRVVLEVDDLSDYDAFLVPNPSRLIIDIHGKQSAKAKPARTVREVADTKIDSRDDAKDETAGKTEGTKQTAIAEQVPPPATKDAAEDREPVEEAKLENTKPTVQTVTIGKTPVKKIIEAGDDDPVPPKKSLARSVEDLRPDLPPAATSVTDAAEDTTLADDSAPKRKSAASHGKGKRKGAGSTADIAPEVDAREARPTAAGDRSLIRALGLKIGKIVIDPGHGGHDTGTIGPDGLEEKDLVVDVGRRLGKLLETRMGAEVVYTRKDDTFIPLETRTAIANRERADLFVSIHANSSHDSSARGIETYYLNFTSSPDALEVAARENAVSEKSIYELGDLVKKIALKEKIEESHEFATNVQQALHSGLAMKGSGIRDRGVKKAPFIVLIGANMPSILAEISFVSNPTDERKLQTSEYRQRIAESLYRGIAKYASGLSGVKVASRVAKNEGQ